MNSEADSDFAGGKVCFFTASKIANQLDTMLKVLHRSGFQSLRVDRTISRTEAHDGAAFGDLIQRCRCPGYDGRMTENDVGNGYA